MGGKIWNQSLRNAGTSALAMLLGCSMAIADSTPSDIEFGEKVRAYLLENPQVILEVMDLLAAQQGEIAMREMLAPHVPDLFEADMDLRMGSPDATRIVVEFFDYNCAVCKANMPAMAAFVDANPDVAIIKKHLPILSPGSERAVRFALATRLVYGTETYAALHDAIYAQIGPLNLSRLEDYAYEMNLDPDAIVDRMQDETITALIDRHRDIAIDLNVIGTPTFLSQQDMHVGAVTPEILQDLADDA